MQAGLWQTNHTNCTALRLPKLNLSYYNKVLTNSEFVSILVTVNKEQP